MYSTPLIADTERSIGVVRKPRTVSAPAPKYTVVITTDELSTLGYCCTGSVWSARDPMRTMTRFTTIARTGCLMKMSLNDFRMIGLSSASAKALCRVGHGDQGRVAQLERSRRRHPLAGCEAV